MKCDAETGHKRVYGLYLYMKFKLCKHGDAAKFRCFVCIQRLNSKSSVFNPLAPEFPFKF